MTAPPPQAERLDNCDVWLDDEQILRVVFKPCHRHGIDEAKALVDAHNRLSNGVKRGVLADLSGVTTAADRAARNYYVTPEASRLKTGMAMVTPSPFQRMLGNIFFRVNKPPYPSRMFQTEDAALTWLRSLENER